MAYQEPICKICGANLGKMHGYKVESAVALHIGTAHPEDAAELHRAQEALRQIQERIGSLLAF